MKWKHYLLIIVFLSFFPLRDYFHVGLPVTHDGRDHVARIANFYQSLAEGNVLPRWAANLNWGYGHPILMFLYPLPSYIASLFHFPGFSFVDSTKLVFILSFIASMLSMYVWVSAVYGLLPGFVAAILYGFAPYRFIDMYVRGAIGEHVAFIFPPLICLGCYFLAKKKKSIIFSGILISIATFGLLLSHNAMSLMFIPIIFAYIIYLYFFESNKSSVFLVSCFWFILEGFLLSAFFLIPAYFEGKYTLRDIVTKGDFTDRFVPFVSFFRSSWNYGGSNQFSKEIGIAHYMSILLGIIFFVKHKGEIRVLLAGLLLLMILSVFLMTSWSQPIWQSISLMQKFQFPWRLLSVTVFLSSFAGGISVFLVNKKYSLILSFLVVLVSIFATAHMWKAQSYSDKQESFYSGIFDSTTDTGESSPIWSVRFMEKRAVAPIEVIEGQANASIISRSSTAHTYRVNAKIKSRLVENTLYFPGWQVLIDRKPVSVEFQDPTYRGLMTFWIEEGEHAVEVAFRDTKLRKMANGISLGGFGLLLLTITILIWKRKT